ncbi:hypothetical protein JTB14_005103 [Gonioctena quinquepunctata]|nr:hypothetical protein JTB14_005103 [Gonioctena quinquepunctata]
MAHNKYYWKIPLTDQELLAEADRVLDEIECDIELVNNFQTDRGRGRFFKWQDNKTVNLILNYHGSEISTVKRKLKDSTSVEVICPAAIEDYNILMGGVDHADQLRSAYGLKRKNPVLELRRFVALGLITQRNSESLGRK